MSFLFLNKSERSLKERMASHLVWANRRLSSFSNFTILTHHLIHQVIPGNLQKYVSTNHSLLQYKTLPAHFSNNMMVYCLLNVI